MSAERRGARASSPQRPASLPDAWSVATRKPLDFRKGHAPRCVWQDASHCGLES